MKGLIIKDFIYIRQQLKLYIIIMILWFVIGFMSSGPEFFCGIMLMFVTMIPMTAIAYDDSSGWDSFVLTAPVSRKQLVLSKYILMGITLIVSAVLAFTGGIVIGGEAVECVFYTVMMSAIGLTLSSVMIPVAFRFGVEKGRFVFLAVIAAVVAAAGAAGSGFGERFDIRNIYLNQWTAAVIMLAAAVLFSVISLKISERIYDKKEF